MDELWTQAAFKGMREGDPIVAQIKKRPQREGRAAQYRDIQGSTKKVDFQKVGAQLQLKPEDARGMSLDDFLKMPNDAGRDMAQQMARHLFTELQKVTEETGNVVDAKGKPFDFEIFLSVLEKIAIEFDEQGRARLPTAVLGPTAYAQLQEKLPEWENDLSLQKRLGEILSAKREQFREREAHRRLVD